MMNELYFDNVVKVGKLYLDHIFYEFESEPIIFSCMDEYNNLYFCLCSEIRYGQKWIITRCNINILKDLIEEEIDIASVFLKEKELIVIDMDIQGNEKSYIEESKSIDRLDLPADDTYLRCDIQSAENYLWLKKCNLICSNTDQIIRESDAGTGNTKIYNIVYSNINELPEKSYGYENKINEIINDRSCQSSDDLNESSDTGETHNSKISVHKYEEPFNFIDTNDAKNNGYLQAA